MKYIREIILGALVLVGFLILSSMISDRQTKLDEYTREYNTFRAGATQTLLVVETLNDSVRRIQETVQSERDRAQTLQREVDRLRASTRQSTATLRDSIARLKLSSDSVELARTVIPKQEELIQELDRANAQKDTTIQKQGDLILHWTKIADTEAEKSRILQFALDTAQNTIRNLPGPPPNPDVLIWGIKKPSRPVVFVSGVILGAAGAVWALR